MFPKSIVLLGDFLRSCIVLELRMAKACAG